MVRAPNPRPKPLRLAEVETWDRALLTQSVADADLRRALDELAKEPAFDGLTWLWGPELLAGVSREWNWAGFGLAHVPSLNDETAVLLYDRFPQVLRADSGNT
jgi:hypothetical protein